MRKIVHYIGLDVHKETKAAAIAKNRYTRCASVFTSLRRDRRPAEPESDGMIYLPETQGGSFLATLG